jgi:hypothetical protein
MRLNTWRLRSLSSKDYAKEIPKQYEYEHQNLERVGLIKK